MNAYERVELWPHILTLALKSGERSASHLFPEMKQVFIFITCCLGHRANLEFQRTEKLLVLPKFETSSSSWYPGHYTASRNK